MVIKSTLFPRSFFDAISPVKKSTLFPRTFFDVISLVDNFRLFPCTFFDVISIVKKSRLFSRPFFWCNFNGQKIHVVSMYFFRCNFDFLVSCKLMKTFGEVFSCVCNFKQVIFARWFSLKFSSKSPWCSPVPLKFEFYNLHHCKKNWCNLVFLVFTEQILYQLILGQLHCYEPALVKKFFKKIN